MSHIAVIGAGLAGVEAAWVLANNGAQVELYEAKPVWFSPAHKLGTFAELVCSNSLRSEEEGHSATVLKEELRSLGSIVMESADKTRLPAGKALAVDRTAFSEYITEKIRSHRNIRVIPKEVRSLSELRASNSECRTIIIATGPLTSPAFTDSLASTLLRLDTPTLYFYDAIAPVVEAGSLDMGIAFKASRWDVGMSKGGDYINCPMTKDEYELFVAELLKADKVAPRDFESAAYFEGCMPVETMAESGLHTLRHGPMKPFGIVDPNTGRMPYAVVQLRQDNLHDTLYNMVGFQTKMTYPEQERVFRLIPGLKNARFERLGSLHRNTFINGPRLLTERLSLKENKDIYIAGQLTGIEGYLESAATGLYAGLSATGVPPPPATTAVGALLNHVANGNPDDFQPMKIMWGIFPPLESAVSTSRGPKKDERRKMMLNRARKDFANWLEKIK